MFISANGAENKLERRFLLYLGIVVLAFVTITICSKSSFFYPINDWGDANIYFEITKGMLHGKVPYRDLYDQKGPFIYFIYAPGVFISEKSFIGIFVLEVIAAALFLFETYKTIYNYSKSKFSLLALPIIAFAVYSSVSFSHGGSAEEFILPLYMFIFCKLFEIAETKHISNKDALLIGICSGIIFWIKFTLVAFPLLFGLYVLFVYIREKKITELAAPFISLLAGVAIPTVIVLGYFAANGSLSYLWEGYFYNNIFMYSNVDEGHTALDYLWWHKLLVIKHNTVVFMLMCVGIVYLAVNKKIELAFLNVCAYGFIFASIYAGGTSYVYYPLIASVCGTFGGAAFVQLFCYLSDKFNSRKNSIFIAFIILSFVSFAGSFICTSNRYMIFGKKADTVEYIFAEKIRALGKNDPSMYVYGTMDRGFYLALEEIPPMRFFCRTNLKSDEINEAQADYVKQRKCNFVVTRYVELNDGEKEKLKFIESCGYKEVDRMSNFFEDHVQTHILYMKE